MDDEASDVWSVVVRAAITGDAAYETACSLQSTSKTIRKVCQEALFEKLEEMRSTHNLWIVFRTPRGRVDVFGSAQGREGVKCTVMNTRVAWGLHNARLFVNVDVDVELLRGTGCQLVLFLEQWREPTVGSYACSRCSAKVPAGTITFRSLVMRHRHSRRARRAGRGDLLPY